MIIKVAEVFTETPGGRYKEQSKFSGEEFRDDILIPTIKKCIDNEIDLIVDLDGTFGYATSFLDEAFGKLVKFFPESEVKKITFISEDEPSINLRIKKYMENNK